MSSHNETLKVVGKKFKNLYVKDVGKQDRWGTYKLLVVCDCGNICEMYKRYVIEYGNCRECGHKKKYTGFEDISGSYWGRLTRGAIERNLVFDIKIQEAWELYILQDKKCVLSGEYIYFDKHFYLKHHKTDQTASLDRIDSSKGYIKGNIQWIHVDLNFMKHEYPQEYFIEMCKRVAKNNEIDKSVFGS